jgi:hypothetical protein
MDAYRPMPKVSEDDPDNGPDNGRGVIVIDL